MAGVIAAVIPIVAVLVMVGLLLWSRFWVQDQTSGGQDLETGQVGGNGQLGVSDHNSSHAAMIRGASPTGSRHEAPVIVHNPMSPTKEQATPRRAAKQSRGEAPAIAAVATTAMAAQQMDVIPPAGGRDFEKHFKLMQKLGEGAYGVVNAAEFRQTGKLYAVKCIDKSRLVQEEDRQAVLVEADILRGLAHPNIVKLYSFFESPTDYYMVMELLRGGELFDRIVSKRHYNEKEARDLVRILLNSIKYCHDRGVVHRDLKPENLLLLSETNDEEIKLCDFGFAKNLQKEPGGVCEGPSSFVGSPGYVAPEILRYQPYGVSVDMWSSGVIIFILLSGRAPFHDENQNRLYRKIKAGNYSMDKDTWRHVSADARDLVRRMLVVDPANRITAAEAVAHPWLVGKDKDLAKRNLDANLEQLKMFNATKKLRAAIRSVMFAGTVDKMLQPHHAGHV